MFKQLTNVQAPKSENPELTTTPTDGTIKLNSPACESVKVANGDYVSVLEDQDTNSEFYGLWLTKGNEKTETQPQFGSKLASATGKNAGSMQFSSGLAYRALKGNENTRVVYSIGEPVAHPDVTSPIYKLTFLREDPKSEKKAPTKKAKEESPSEATNS